MDNHTMLSRKKNDMLGVLAMLLLALYPMLHWYDIGLPIGLGDVLMVLVTMLAIGMLKFELRSYLKVFLLVWAYIAFNWYYYNVTADWKSLLPGGVIFFIFAVNIGTFISLFNMESLKTCMKWVTVVAVLLFVFQYIMLLLMGENYCLVPNLTGSFIYEDMTYDDLVRKQLGDGSPSAFFLEKSYMAYYLVMYLCLELFTGKGKEKLFTPLSIVIILTLLLLRSGSGLLGMSIPIITKIVSFFWRKGSTGIVMFVLLIPLLILVVYIYSSSDIGTAMLERQEEFSTQGTSGFTRVVYGYMYYERLDPLQKMIGISVKDINDLIYLSYSDSKFALNGIQAILVQLGLVGLILWSVFYLKVMKDSTICGIMCVCVFFVLSTIEVTYLGPYMTMLTVVACAEITKKKKKRNENPVYLNTGIC